MESINCPSTTPLPVISNNSLAVPAANWKKRMTHWAPGMTVVQFVLDCMVADIKMVEFVIGPTSILLSVTPRNW